jgi:hypothetical protein
MPLFGTQFVNLSGDAAMKGMALGQQAAATGMEGKLKQQQLRQQQSQFDATSGLRAQQERLAQYQADAYGKKNQYIDQIMQGQVAMDAAQLDRIMSLLPGEIEGQSLRNAGMEISNATASAELAEWKSQSDLRLNALDTTVREGQERLRQLGQQGKLLDQSVNDATSPLARAIAIGGQQLTRRQQTIEMERLSTAEADLEAEREMARLRRETETAEMGLKMVNIEGQEAWLEMLGSGGGKEYMEALSPQAKKMLGEYVDDLSSDTGITDPARARAAGVALQRALEFDLSRNQFTYKEGAETTRMAVSAAMQSQYAANMPTRVQDLVALAEQHYAAGKYGAANTAYRRAHAIARDHNKTGAVLASARNLVPQLVEGWSAGTGEAHTVELFEEELQEWVGSRLVQSPDMSPMQATRLRAQMIYKFGSPEIKGVVDALVGGSIPLDDDAYRDGLIEGLQPWALGSSDKEANENGDTDDDNVEAYGTNKRSQE